METDAILEIRVQNLLLKLEDMERRQDSTVKAIFQLYEAVRWLNAGNHERVASELEDAIMTLQEAAKKPH
ncbi:hypothetical protein NDA01_14215 [Trichocoleus desertorum AS-A10]|uniref:hypothetical protein n=1 Tax=Trichocoleus desertorum TaxID=1481672 RepID=UPI003298A3FD